MKINGTTKFCLVAVFSLIITSCGTFEVGLEAPVEQNSTPERPTPTVAVESTTPIPEPSPTRLEPTDPPVESTPTPFDEYELMIRAALSSRLGVPPEELQVTFAQYDGTFAVGGVSNGYFLAVNDLNDRGSWVIAYDGQGTPSCSQVDPFGFPPEMVPECLDASNNLVFRTERTHDDISGLESLDCGPGSSANDPGSVQAIACNIQDGLRSRNISALLGYMADPFIIGYWQSEGVSYTPSEFIDFLPNLYNFNDPDYTPRLTFTTDRSKFPDFDGIQLENILGPDADIVELFYSQGWGPDGQGDAVIFLVEDEPGKYLWPAMLMR